MGEQKRYYQLLDLARLYCAFLIVVIHLGLGNDCSLVPCLTRQGVPFFFMTSGFFLSKKLRKSNDIKQTTIRYIKPILGIYCVWALLWFPSTVIKYHRMYPGNPVKLAVVLSRRIILAGFAQYWYLLVLVEGAIILAVLIRYRKMAAGVVLCVLGIALSVIYNYQMNCNPNGLVYRFFYNVFSWDCNVIMSGFPMLFLGAVMDVYEDRLQKGNFWVLIVLYPVSIVIAFVVYRFHSSLFYIPFGIFQAVLLFLLCIIPVSFLRSIPERICRNSRNASSVVYLTHTVFLAILTEGLHFWNYPVQYAITVVCAIVVYWIVKKVNWRPLNHLMMVK